jgi:hypothetical protein
MNTRAKFALTSILAVMVILVFLFGGAGATAFAARSALPGDALYPVKTGLENTRVALAGNEYVQAQLNMRFAELRLEELNAAVDEGVTEISIRLPGSLIPHSGCASIDANRHGQTRSWRAARWADQPSFAQVCPGLKLPCWLFHRKPASVERMILTSEHGSGSDGRHEMGSPGWKRWAPQPDRSGR